MKPGGRKGESAGSEAGDKEKWPARPPGAQLAGEPGQDGRWGPEEGAQKPGDKIRAVFFAGYQGQPPLAGGAGAPARPCKSFGARKKDQKPRRINPQRQQARPLATQRPLRTARGAGAPLQVYWGKGTSPGTPSHKTHKGSKPTKETTPQPTNLRKKRGKAAASLCAVERIISRW